MRKRFQPTIAFVMLSAGCNKKPRCKHCYLPPETGSISPEKGINRTRALQNKGYFVTMVGGEPLIKPGYLKCYQAASQVTLLSNGIELVKNPGLLDMIREHGISRIRFSMNFEMSKELGSVPEETVMQAIRICRERHFQIDIGTLITSKNYMNGGEYVRRAAELGAGLLHFYRYLDITGSRIGSDLVANENQVNEFFALTHHRKNPKVIYDGGFGPNPTVRRRLLAAGEEFCPAGTNFFTIAPSGDVYACPFLMGDGMEIGRFERGDIVLHTELRGPRIECLATHIDKIELWDIPLKSPLDL